MSGATVERRTTTRHATGGFIRWTPADSAYAREGHLCDCSARGVSFTTARQDVPLPGERIRILGGDSARQLFAVMRVRALDPRMALVACSPV